MYTANVRITPIYRSNNMLEMLSDSISEHAILKILLGDIPLNPPSNSMLMLAVLSTAFNLPDQCCVAKPASTTHAQWPTQPLF